jgi:hypothetical protein
VASDVATYGAPSVDCLSVGYRDDDEIFSLILSCSAVASSRRRLGWHYTERRSERASELRALIECDDLGLLVVNDDYDDCVPNKICDKAVT